MIGPEVSGDVRGASMRVQDDSNQREPTGLSAVRLALLVAALALAGCAASSSSSSSGELPPGWMTITVPAGRPSFDSRCVTSAALTGTMLDVSCGDTKYGADRETYAAIVIRAYHGAGSYILTSSDDGSVQFVDGDNVIYGVPKVQPGAPATKCAVEIEGQASPTHGDVISGTFHCENLMGNHLYGDGRYQPPSYEAVDGSFVAPIFTGGH